MNADERIVVGVIGYGYWGPNLVRNFMGTKGACVRYVSDLSESRLEHARQLYPSVTTVEDPEVVLADPEVDLVVIATPPSTHADLAVRALNAGKHAFVEKPLASSAEEADRICATARRVGRHVFVDHTFVFTPAVRKMCTLAHDQYLGRLLYYDSTRINLGLFQRDVDVIWDLLPHDLSILDYLLHGKMPSSVSCVGAAHYITDHSELAYVSLRYPDGFLAHIHVNWIAPVKIRQILLGGDQRMLVYDDINPSEKIKVYDRGVNVNGEDRYTRLVQYRDGDMLAPKIENAEALTIEARHVIKAIKGEEEPIVPGASGARVVRLLEAASASLLAGGRQIDVVATELEAAS